MEKNKDYWKKLRLIGGKIEKKQKPALKKTCVNHEARVLYLREDKHLL